MSLKTDKEVNILYISTGKTWLIVKRKKKSYSNNGSWRHKAFFLAVTMVTASFKQRIVPAHHENWLTISKYTPIPLDVCFTSVLCHTSIGTEMNFVDNSSRKWLKSDKI